METDGGGWTIIQRRKVGLTSFNRDWKQYRDGFGNIRGDFWLGNENIYRLSRRPTVLRVELEVINKLLISAAKGFFAQSDSLVADTADHLKFKDSQRCLKV